MDCPTCHAENAAEAATCTACGRALRREADPPNRRPSSRRRRGELDPAIADDTSNPAALRAYRVSLWSLLPGLGLLLGPAAVLLGLLALRQVGDDAAARNRSRAAVLFGTLVALTQWAGAALMVHGWRG